MRNRAIILTSIILLFSANAHALKTDTYERLKKSSPETLKTYITGLGEGMSWLNADLQVKGQPLSFCEPTNLPLNAQNYMDLIDSELHARADMPDTRDLPIGFILLRAMQRQFPCK